MTGNDNGGFDKKQQEELLRGLLGSMAGFQRQEQMQAAMRELASVAWSTYTAMKDAGFNETQAMQLTIHTLQSILLMAK